MLVESAELLSVKLEDAFVTIRTHVAAEDARVAALKRVKDYRDALIAGLFALLRRANGSGL